MSRAARSDAEPIAAVAEADAPPHIAALYADIGALAGVPMVNLIFRHLAASPGALEWTWGTLRPLYAAGVAQGAAERVLGALVLPALPRLPLLALTAVGVDTAAARGLARVLDSYTRANAINLVALTALRLGFRPQRPAEPAAVGFAARSLPPASRAPLPRLLDRSEVSPQTWALIRYLNAFGEVGDGMVVASMYRHLAHWPGFLALAAGALVAASGGELGASIAQAREAAESQARAMLPLLSNDPPPDAELFHAVLGAVEAFTANTIVKMVPIGALLRRMLPAVQEPAR
ncbi:MAG: hypothetical protein AB7N53_12890 [Candidatus Binatia bacterium]